MIFPMGAIINERENELRREKKEQETKRILEEREADFLNLPKAKKGKIETMCGATAARR